jgi:histidinol dehydrogenase
VPEQPAGVLIHCLGNEVAYNFRAIAFLTILRFVRTNGDTALDEYTAAFGQVIATVFRQITPSNTRNKIS